MDFTTLGAQALDIALMVLTILLMGSLAFGLYKLYEWWRRYREYAVVIWEQNGFGQWNESSDVAGIFVDKKTNNKRLFLKRNNVGLNADNVPYLPGKKGKKVIYLLRTGLKNFHFININPKFPEVELQVGEEDVNWAVNAYERQKKIFQNNLFLQMLPYIALVVTGMIIAIIFIYFFKELSTLKEFGGYMKETAQMMLQMKTGIVPS